MTNVELLADAIVELVCAPRPLKPEDAAGLFELLGWEMAGSSSQPFPREWTRAGLEASIFGRGAASVEFVVWEMAPDWDNPQYVAAVEGDYVNETLKVGEVRSALFNAFNGRVAAEFVSEETEIEELLFGSDWRINGVSFAIGLAHQDAEDLPILIMAYVDPDAE
ncbi:hypothetical protein GCM10027290_15720 [Micromonospora sonneratiae]|uniref:SUKH-3 immunity protein n=1 Tax=Micromonospora sonneratiae TaxID=1184706 RepID=A0ABW3Y9W9_9ACTN